MKNSLILLLILYGLTVRGQTFINGNFNTWTFSGGDCYYTLLSNSTSPLSPLVPSCGFHGWIATHGSPEIYKSGAENQAFMWVGRWSTNTVPTGEGIAQYCDFRQGKVYHLTCTVRSSAGTNGTGNPVTDDHVDNVYLKLANGVSFVNTVDYNPVSSIYSITPPVSQQTIYTVNNLGSSTQNLDFYFIPDQNYEYIWVYPYHSNGPSRIAILLADNFAIEGCQLNATYTNTSSLPGVTLRSDYITAGTNTTVSSGQNVSFSAGNYIQLNPGFASATGSNFRAYIGGCDAEFSCANPWQKPSSVDEGADDLAAIIVSPNPGSGLFHLDVKSMKLKDIYMYDMLGKIVYSKTATTDQQFDIDIHSQAPGLYVVKVVSGSDVQSVKVVNE